MQRKEKTGNGILRLIFVAVALLVQILWILLRIQYLNAYSERIATITAVLTVLVVLKLNSKPTNSAMKMPWILLIMALPVMGLSMYLLFELLGDPGVGRRLRKVREYLQHEKGDQAETVLERLSQQDPGVANQFRYLWKVTGQPPCTNTRVQYYAEAVEAFEALKTELEKSRTVYLSGILHCPEWFLLPGTGGNSHPKSQSRCGNQAAL